MGGRWEPGEEPVGRVDAGLRGLLCAAGWFAGLALQLQQPSLWPPLGYVTLSIGGLLLALAAAVSPRRATLGATLALAIGLGALGFGSTGGRAELRLSERLPAELEGVDLLVTGVISGLPQGNPTGTRFVFEPESARLAGQPVALPPKLSLGWYRGFDPDAMVGGPPEALRAGQRWQLTLRLRQPHGSMNPHGFDLELWLFEQGIGAGGYVRAVPGAVNRKLDETAGQPVSRLRQSVRDAILRTVPDPAAAGVLAALAIGDQAAIDRSEWDLFRLTGVAHLMSISGLHVTMFAWLAGALVGRLWRLHPRAMLAVPAPTAARWGGLLLAAGYAVLAGWGVPAQRTVAMIAAVVLLRSAGLRWPPLAVLVAAGVAVTLLDPWALLQPGFWLSFAAVGLLMASEPSRSEREVPSASTAGRLRDVLRAGLRTQVVATVGLTPLTLVFFQQVSLVGFVANLVAIPLVTLFVTPLALLGVLLPLAWSAAAALVQALIWGLQALAALPGAVWTTAAAPPWAVVAGLLGGALLVMPLPRHLRLAGLALLLPLLWPTVERPPEGRFEAVAADIGQGTAVLVRTHRHLLVYDTGPAYSPEADAGQRVLLPLLRVRGETAVHRLMLSHRDTDHVGGAASLIASGLVQSISSSLSPAHPLLARGLPHEPCAAGQSWTWDGVLFEVLHPEPGALRDDARPNTQSCVLKVSAQARGDAPATSLLLTGDIEAAQEAALIERQRARLPSSVLLVPHHGSRTSSTAGFIDAVSPQVAVVQAGYRSRFGHPAPDVVARYREQGIAVVRSDRCGAWTLRHDGSTACERWVSGRYWHHRASPRPDEDGADGPELACAGRPSEGVSPCRSTLR